MDACCINMSGHALMGRPAARLDRMTLVFRIVCLGMCFRSKAMTFPVCVLFFHLCDVTPVFLIEIDYYESNVIQRMNPRTDVS